MKLGSHLTSIPATDRSRLNPDYGYLSTLFGVLMYGDVREDRTGVGTISHFGARTLYTNLHERFPLITVKKVWWHGVIAELIWMLRGQTNIKPLTDQGVHIWDEWADENGNLGPVYGAQWRNWVKPIINEDGYYDGDQRLDQIADLIDGLKNNPFSRRHIISAWNVGEIPDMKLPPCHMVAQFYVRDCPTMGRCLDCQLYQRSADMFLGVPFNIASYAALTALLGMLVGMKAGRLIHVMGDAHVYTNHLDAIDKMLDSKSFAPPKLRVNALLKDIDKVESKHFRLIGYKSGPPVSAPVAV
jgi:thymidylate synthase